MAIQMRRGALADLDPTKLLPGEFAISTTGEPMVCRKAGDVVKMLTDKDQADLEALLLQLTELKSSIDTLIVQKVGINDAEATLTEAYSGSKTQTLLNAKAAQTAVDILNQSYAKLNSELTSALRLTGSYLEGVFDSTSMDEFDPKKLLGSPKYVIGEVKSTYTNCPTWGICEIIKTDDTILQRITSWDNGSTYVRTLIPSTKAWTTWKAL